MARYFLRNVKPYIVADNRGPSMMTNILRHLFWWADWTEISLDADAAWANTIAINDTAAGGPANPGFSVLGTSPQIVTDNDVTGRFAAHMVTNEYLIVLKGTGQNRVVARISRFIDAHNVEIDADSSPPLGWADEAMIPGRVIGGDLAGTNLFNNAGGTLAAAKGVLVQAPTGNLQCRVYHQTTTIMQVFARPKGGAGTATEVGAGTNLVVGTDNHFRIHGVFEGRNALVYSTIDSGLTASFVFLVGELEDVEPGDTDPGIIMMDRDLTTTYPWAYSMHMLNGNPVPVSIAAYGLFITRQFGDTISNANQIIRPFRLTGQKAAIRKVRIMLDNVLTYGACLRGKLPLVRYCHTEYEKFRPMDAAGAWMHLNLGLVVPRNGPGDQRPIVGSL
jgi:hypothetical protein